MSTNNWIIIALIFGLLFTAVSSIGFKIREYKANKRNIFKDILLYVFILGFLFTAGSGITIKLKENRDKTERANIEKTEIIKRDEQYAIIKNLETSNKELLNKLNPIVELAKQRYPQMNEYDALNKLRDDFYSLQKRTMELEIKAKPRQIYLSEIVNRKNYFENCKGYKIELSASASSSEAKKLAQQLLPIFKNSGLVVNDPINGFISPDGLTGVAIYIDDLKSNFAKALKEFFKDIQIKAEFILSQPNIPNSANIQVWPKE